MMTELLFTEDSYAKEFDAVVTKVDGRFIVLDKTLFYPQGGGQPADEGILTNDHTEYRVVSAKKMGSDVSHEVDKEGLKVGDKVCGKIDWDRRYLLMRMHTAAHIFADVIEKDAGKLITGNSLGIERSRIDFNLEDFDKEKIQGYADQANKMINRELDVDIDELPYDDAMKLPDIVKLKDILPPTIKNLRIVDIKEMNMQACGGTHVKNTREIGIIEVIKAENRGKNNRRVYFKLKEK